MCEFQQPLEGIIVVENATSASDFVAYKQKKGRRGVGNRGNKRSLNRGKGLEARLRIPFTSKHYRPGH